MGVLAAPLPTEHSTKRQQTAIPSAETSITDGARQPTAHTHTAVTAAADHTAQLTEPAPGSNSNTTPLSSRQPSTPIHLTNLAQELTPHPDQNFVSDLLYSLRPGADVVFRGPVTGLVANNLKSALQHPEVVTSSLNKEVGLNRMAGPYHDPPCPDLHCSGLGTVPKSDGSHRLIMHLSAPRRSSVNDGISRDDFTVSYITIDDAAKLVAKHGRGALMSKVDLESAFRLIPVRPADRRLLGCFWQSKYYVDLALPFGLRSAPAIFDRLARAIEFILRNNYGIEDLLHYLDDFFTVHAPSLTPATSVAAIQKATILAILDSLGIPVSDSPGKVVGPSTRLTLLGIEFDSVRWQMSLPAEKLDKLHAALAEWGMRRTCTKRQLLSLVGSLAFAAKLVPPGRTFTRRLIDLSMCTRSLSAQLTLTPAAQADITWWQTYLPTWNGRTLIPDLSWTKSPEFELFTDAAGLHGFGTYFQGRWCHGHWTQEQAGLSLTWKELFPIALSCRLWGHLLTQRKLLVHCDNASVVAVMASGTSRDPYVAQLVRDVFFSAAKYQFVIFVQHLLGTSNVVADSLSRFQMEKFRRLAPDADSKPTPSPNLANWWAPWRARPGASSLPALHRAHAAPTPPGSRRIVVSARSCAGEKTPLPSTD